MRKNKLFKNLKAEMEHRGYTIPDELISLKKAYDSTEVKQMVSYNDFKKFIIENVIKNYKLEKRGHIVALNSLQVRSKRFTNYIDMNSNKQFITLYNLNNTQLIAMLNHFIGQMETEIVITMIKYNKTDEEILNYIKDNYIYINEDTKKSFKYSKIATISYNYFLKNIENPNILDIGTGNGKKIKSILSFLNDDYKYNLYGADIEEWGSYKKNRKLDFPLKIIQTKPYKIPYDDKMFDCIFIILTLHHAENIMDVLKEAYRILKDDGCIVLIEHDVWIDDTHMLIDLQHRIYKTINCESSDSTKATYYNFYEWDFIFYKNGFKHVHGTQLNEDIANNIRYDMEHVKIFIKSDKVSDEE